MAREGRDLEQLVALLERILSNEDVEIRSPDYIQGVMSNSRREIDISLKTHIGSSEILVILECRDRDDTEGVAWIEQLAAKRTDVLAAKAVAISSTGFSEGARNAATNYGIELRTIQELTNDAVSDWFHVSELIKIENLANILIFNLHAADEAAKEKLSRFRDLLKSDPNVNSITPFLTHTQTGNKLSILQVWQEHISTEGPQIFNGVIPNSERIQRIVNVNFPNPQNRFLVMTDEGAVEIGRMEFQVELWSKLTTEPISKISQYSDKEGSPIVQSVSFVTEYKGETVELSIHKVAGEIKKFVSMRVNSGN